MTIEHGQTSANQEKPKFYPLVPVVLKPETQPESLTQSQSQISAESLIEPETPTTGAAQDESAPIFEVSPSLIEPTTASIYIESVPDANNMTHVLETGEILTTGAIDISKLLADTGELTKHDEQADDGDVAPEASLVNSSSFAPLRAKTASNFGAEFSIVPAKLNRGEGQLYVALTVSISLVAIGSLVLAGYMLDFFK